MEAMWGNFSPLGRLFTILTALLFLGAPDPARAAGLIVGKELCYAITDESIPAFTSPRLTFRCDGKPADYQKKSLWLKLADAGGKGLGSTTSLMINMSRFDRLTVGFRYADGSVNWQSVSSGRYDAHWRIGGQLKFEAPHRDAPLDSVLLRFDRPTDHEFIRVRLIPEAMASQQSAVLAAVVACAITLLALSCVYSLALAWVVRRQYLLWQAAWGAGMVLWGLIWSQVNLAVFPAMAGTASAQIASFLACACMAFATISAMVAPGRGAIPPYLKYIVLSLAGVISAGGLALSLIRNRPLAPLDGAIGYIMLADLILIVVGLGIAWRRGSHEGRDMLIAWSLPMFVLGAISLLNIHLDMWGGGTKLLMLMAATWQALWIAGAVTRRLAMLRRERDEAQLSAEKAIMLAERDPMTGLFNRRGFIGRMTVQLEKARQEGLPAALMLLDIDQFKSINDAYGHEVGDHILCRVSKEIADWEGANCTASRMGGEEFALLVIGVEGLPLRRLAENVRRSIGEREHPDLIGDRRVTVSIGVAEVHPAGDFETLYRMADGALYAAKNGGRDRVTIDVSEFEARPSATSDSFALT